MLRAINSILAIVVFGLFVLHTVLNIPTLVWYAYIPWSGIFAKILVLLILLHAIIGIGLAIQSAILRGKERVYVKLSWRTLFFIITGCLMLILTVVHFYSFGYTLPTGEYVVNEPTIQMFLVNVLFTVVAATHCACGLENAAISFGLRTQSNKIAIRTISYCLSGIVGIAGIVAYIIYYVPSIFGPALTDVVQVLGGVV